MQSGLTSSAACIFLRSIACLSSLENKAALRIHKSRLMPLHNAIWRLKHLYAQQSSVSINFSDYRFAVFEALEVYSPRSPVSSVSSAEQSNTHVSCLQDSVLSNPEAISAKRLRQMDESEVLKVTGCPQLPLLSERARLLREVRYCSFFPFRHYRNSCESLSRTSHSAFGKSIAMSSHSLAIKMSGFVRPYCQTL